MLYRMSKEQARNWLREALGDETVDFRRGQWEAIDALVNRRQRLLVVEKTGWAKSIVYLSARLLRQKNADALVIVISPLISLMRNQIEQARRIQISAVTINFSNCDDWEQHFQVRTTTLYTLMRLIPSVLRSYRSHLWKTAYHNLIALEAYNTVSLFCSAVASFQQNHG